MADAIPVPLEVVHAVDEYVDSEQSDCDRFDNRALLDESGIWSLHRLAARMYAMGFDAGSRVGEERIRQAWRRERTGRPT